jgi:hypothetical protein
LLPTAKLGLAHLVFQVANRLSALPRHHSIEHELESFISLLKVGLASAMGPAKPEAVVNAACCSDKASH